MKRATFAMVAGLLLTAGCTIGSPPGFSSGDSWAIPLVAPLEDGAYLVPVKINGKGPYLFVIDPDSPVSHVDSLIQSDQDLYAVRAARKELDERDNLVNISLAEVLKLQVGDKLTVRNLKVRVHAAGTYWIGGHKVRGVLGRDVIADSLIFAANRDTGMAYLATNGHYAIPPDAKVIKFRRYRQQNDLPRRRLTTATINKRHKVTMHIDLGSHTSMLWIKKMKKLGLPALRVRSTVVDEVATTRRVTSGAMAASIQVADVEVNGVLLIPYEDKRTRDTDLDGALGQNFFADYNVVADWNNKAIYLTPRDLDPGAKAAERMRRWGPAFDKCKNPACVTIAMRPNHPGRPAARPPAPPPAEAGDPPPAAGAPAEPPAVAPVPAPMPPQPSSYTMRITKEEGAPSQAYELLVEAIDNNGKPIGLPRLVVSLGADSRVVQDPNFDPNYALAAGFRVLDLSPFPRDCRNGRCIWTAVVKR